MSEELDNVVELMGEDGKLEKFEVLDMIRHNENDYVMLKQSETDEKNCIETDADGSIEEVPVIVMKMLVDDKGEYNLQPVTDESEMEEVFEIFVENVLEDEG